MPYKDLDYRRQYDKERARKRREGRCDGPEHKLDALDLLALRDPLVAAGREPKTKVRKES